MAGSAVMILHGSRAGSPVLTDTGLLPICCPDVADPTFETTIRITHLQHASCLSWKLDDLRFV
jgi:hypothetical protein